jgi:hypothetical protein
MSYQFRGTTYHDREQYNRVRAEAEAQDARQQLQGARKAAVRLERGLNQLQAEHARDVRQIQRRQTALEEQQQEHQRMLRQVATRQEEYERAANARADALENDIEDVRQELHQEVADVRQEMERGQATLRNEIVATRVQLESSIRDVKNELAAERGHREKKEQDRGGDAAGLVSWVESRIGGLTDIEALDLAAQGVGITEKLAFVRQTLNGPDRERALPMAEAVFTDYQTTLILSEQRKGTIDGVADHVDSIVATLREITSDETFQKVFPGEADQIRIAAAALEARTAAWRKTLRWRVFENERGATVQTASALLASMVELQAAAPLLAERIRQRDSKVEGVASTISEVAGLADAFETSFANPSDPKSARLLRARIGTSTVDTYLHLDGGFHVDAYGFRSPGECQRTADRMHNKLSESWDVEQASVSAANPQSASIRTQTSTPSWQSASNEIREAVTRLA